MPTYVITVERTDGSLLTTKMFGATSAQACQNFRECCRHNAMVNITSCEVYAKDVSVTKEQERKAVQQICAIIASLGPESETADILEQCLEVALAEISGLRKSLEASMIDFETATNEAAIRKDDEIARLKAKIEALREAQKTGESVMNKYYYSFGSDPSFPFYMGWVEVHAHTWEEAHAKFRAKYPDRPGHEGTLNCAFFYDEDSWARMDPEHNWPGCKCWAVIE